MGSSIASLMGRSSIARTVATHSASLLRLAMIGAVIALLPACQSTFARQQSIGYAAGDAVAWNKSVHTIDPWPLASLDTTIPVSGRKVAAAIERYELQGAEPVSGPPPAGLVPVAPIAIGPTP
jgi:hypothetical protein